MKPNVKVSTPEETKNRYDVALLGAETGNSLSFRSQETEFDQGPPLHVHTEQDETFHVVSGNFRFIVGSEEVFASDGTTLFVPRNTPHSWLYLGKERGKLLSVLTPGIYDGFILDVPKAQRVGVSNQELGKLASENGTEIVGPKQNYNSDKA